MYGFRDVPTTLTVAQAGSVETGWLSSDVTVKQIYDILSMVTLLNQNKVAGPYALILPSLSVSVWQRLTLPV